MLLPGDPGCGERFSSHLPPESHLRRSWKRHLAKPLSRLSDISTSAGEDAALPSGSPTDVALLSDDDSWSSERASK